MTVTAFLKKSNLTCQTEGMNIITMDLCTFSVAALDEQRDHIQFGRTEYKIHLLSYIRLCWTTSEFTGRLQNLLDDFRIYWTTSDFYWTTWVLEVKISSATWPGGSVLITKEEHQRSELNTWFMKQLLEFTTKNWRGKPSYHSFMTRGMFT